MLLGLGLAAAGVGYWIILAPNTPVYTGERSVKIPPGSSFEAAVDSLESTGILGASRTFRWMAKATGWGGQIKAGHYSVESGASNYDLLNTLRKGLQSPIRLTIPPGTRPEVAAAVAGRDMYFSTDEFEAALRDSALAAELGTDTRHLFGYLQPETYHFYWLTPAPTVVRKIKQEFDRFYTDAMKAGADSLGLTTDEVVRMASIVEWETSIEEEKPRVAGVYLNRLRIGMPLQADPTVQYAVLEQEGQKRRLLFQDYNISHPYNTYQFRGLPPGPLTNPARSSIRAVVQPEKHDYLYFVATGNGGHTFSRTLAEHNRAAQQYRQTRDRRIREQQAADGDG